MATKLFLAVAIFAILAASVNAFELELKTVSKPVEKGEHHVCEFCVEWRYVTLAMSTAWVRTVSGAWATLLTPWHHVEMMDILHACGQECTKLIYYLVHGNELKGCDGIT